MTVYEVPKVSCGADGVEEPQALLAAASEAYIGFDPAGRVVGWNPAATGAFGYEHEQACGRQVTELIIPPRCRTAHRAGLARIVAGDPDRTLGQRLQLSALHCDGHEFPIEMSLTVTDEPRGRIFHAFAHDITTAQRANRFTAVESAVARGLAEADSSAVAACRVVEALGVKMGWPVVELWLADDDRQLLACASRHVQQGQGLHEFALTELERGVGLPGRVCADGAAKWIPDLAADTRSLRSRAAARIGLRVAVGVPISDGQHTIGALCVYGDQVEDPEDTLIGLLGGLAAQIGRYLQRRRAEELAVELARTKDEFLAMVTHELRNPLSIITGTAALLSDELADLTDEQRHYLRVIGRNAERLAVMADDLLDLASLESGHLAVQPTDTDLRPIIDQAVQAVGAQIADKQLAITVHAPDRLVLHADPDRLRQVADNLLSNAVKYTPAGGTVTITAALNDTPETITWTVSDTGIGIPPAERPRLFRRFYRASTALDRRIPGTGLGLVITRTIIERHRGTIDLQPHSGPGTTFAIELPIKPE